MRRIGVTIVFTVLALAIRGATAASTPAALLCVRQAQADLEACRTLAHQAGDQCTGTYFNAVPPCFGADAPCASECITTRMSCETGPKDQQASRSACACRTQRSAAGVLAAVAPRIARDRTVNTMVTPIRRIPSSLVRGPALPMSAAGLRRSNARAGMANGGCAPERARLPPHGRPALQHRYRGRPIGQRGRRRRGTFSDARLWRADRGSGRVCTRADDANELRLDGVGHHVAPPAELVVEPAAHLDHLA